MYLTICLLLVAVGVCTAEYNHILSDEFIKEINNKQSLWKAGRNFDPNTNLTYLKGLLGINKNVILNREKIETIYHNVNKNDIPEYFDARENWNNCPSLKEIADQSGCGSCWAVASASAMTDRVCIANNGRFQEQISASNIMCCCSKCGYGCQGGLPIHAFRYWVNTGIVSGGAYNTTEGCQNYPFPPCAHHSTGSKPSCLYYSTPPCHQTCDSGWSQSYNDSLTFGSSAYYVGTKEEQIQAEILKNGPVVGDFTVFSDFYSYKSGIYKHTSGDEHAGHAVRILGWGVENGVKYWIMANSWNPDWGDNGFFKMIRGQNECGIEEDIVAGLPKVS